MTMQKLDPDRILTSHCFQIWHDQKAQLEMLATFKQTSMAWVLREIIDIGLPQFKEGHGFSDQTETKQEEA